MGLLRSGIAFGAVCVCVCVCVYICCQLFTFITDNQTSQSSIITLEISKEKILYEKKKGYWWKIDKEEEGKRLCTNTQTHTHTYMGVDPWGPTARRPPDAGFLCCQI